MGNTFSTSICERYQSTNRNFSQYESGLNDLEGFSHIVVLFHFHRNPVSVLSLNPFVENISRGVFSTRAPMRPNNIGMSVVRLDKIEKNILHIRAFFFLELGIFLHLTKSQNTLYCLQLCWFYLLLEL